MSSTTPRIQLGPLTTTFTLPPACTPYAAISNNASQDVFYGGQSCQQGQPRDWSTCWPSASIQTKSNPLAGFGFYSPGVICPSGFISACTQFGISKGAQSIAVPHTSFSFQFAPTGGETAIGCCPSGFTCTRVDGYNWQTCRQDATSGSLSVGLCDSSDSTFAEVTRVSIGPDTSLIYAPMFQLMYQSTDVARTSSDKATDSLQTGSSSPSIASATDNSAAAAITNSAASSSGSSSAANSSDLSTGAKIGLGVGIPLAVILLVALGTILFLRRRKAKSHAIGTANELPHNSLVEVPATKTEKAVYNPHEVSAGQWVNEMGSHTPQTMYELPSGNGTGTR